MLSKSLIVLVLSGFSVDGIHRGSRQVVQSITPEVMAVLPARHLGSGHERRGAAAARMADGPAAEPARAVLAGRGVRAAPVVRGDRPVPAHPRDDPAAGVAARRA